VTNYFYLAKPVYGGWVSFSAHLLHKLNKKLLYRIGGRLEKNSRNFGYGIMYQNVPIEIFNMGHKNFILALDKHHLHLLPIKNATIVVHDPTELKDELIGFLEQANVITIRKVMHNYLKSEYDIESEYKPHPFFEYPTKPNQNKSGAVATSRIDFDKHTEIILKANKLLKNPIQIFGAVNRLYEHFNLKELNLPKYYQGTFEKSFQAISDILNPAKYMVDMSIIKHDGGGTQYTFLEAIYHDTALILQRKWIEADTIFKEGVNCLAVDDEAELAEIIKSDTDVNKITSNAKKLLKTNIEANWQEQT
jgi:hypothetical protein